jgi:hypothetical protein
MEKASDATSRETTYTHAGHLPSLSWQAATTKMGPDSETARNKKQIFSHDNCYTFNAGLSLYQHARPGSLDANLTSNGAGIAIICPTD